MKGIHVFARTSEPHNPPPRRPLPQQQRQQQQQQGGGHFSFSLLHRLILLAIPIPSSRSFFSRTAYIYPQWCSYSISPVDGAGPPIFDNDFGLPIITSGTCGEVFGDLGMRPDYNSIPESTDEFTNMTRMLEEFEKKDTANGKVRLKIANYQNTAEEICKNMAEDNDATEEEYTWGGRCAGLSREDGTGKEKGADFWKCWEEDSPSTEALSDKTKPYGCFLSAAEGDTEKTVLNWNRDTSGTTECSPEHPCVCAQSNMYCDAKKYVLCLLSGLVFCSSQVSLSLI